MFAYAIHNLRHGYAIHNLRQGCLLSTSVTTAQKGKFNQPKSPNEMLRVGGIPTMFRLPLQENNPENLDACIVGIPLDTGCSNRSGTRSGPRSIRCESTIIRPQNSSGADPFQSLQIADIGDVPIVPYNLIRSVDIIRDYYRKIFNANCTPLTVGGDHTLTLPILRAAKEMYGAVGLIQIDAHLDLLDTSLGEKIAHGTPFRRALEEECISPKHMFQIGLRGAMYGESDLQTIEWAQKMGVKMVFAEQCWHRSMVPLMEMVRKEMGDFPTYITFDIDGIDPMACPGTGTPEVAGLTAVQAIEIVRGCQGLNVIGADVVEINPLYDPSGITSNMAANLLFEQLCVLPGVKYVDTQYRRNFVF